MPLLQESGAMAMTGGPADQDRDDLALLWVDGSVALDTQAKTAIKAALKQAGIKLVSERLLSAGSHVKAGAADSPPKSTTPRLAFLVSTVAGTEEGLEELLDGSLIAEFGNCFAISSDSTQIEWLFPPVQETEAVGEVVQDAGLPPSHERRVFTFNNEEVGPLNEDDQRSQVEDDEEDDFVAGQLVAKPASPLPGTERTVSGQSMPTSRSGTGMPVEGKGQDPSRSPSVNESAAQPERRTSAFKARKAPSSSSAPAITPRLSKAAALRMGVELQPKRQVASTDMDANGHPPTKQGAFVPGTAQRAVTPPKSLSKPIIAPRQNRASALRNGDVVDQGMPMIRPPTKRRESLGTSQRSIGFEGLPGFAKRVVRQSSHSSSENIASPAQNKTSLLRQKSQEGYLAPLPRPTQRRQSLTTAERAAAFERSRSSLDHDSLHALSIHGSSRSGTPSTAARSRPLSSREASLKEDEEIAVATAILDKSRLSPARPPSVVPRPNEAAELLSAAQKGSRK